MTARELLATWEARDAKYLRWRRALTHEEVEAVRDWRYKEARAVPGGDELRSLASYWTQPGRWA